MTLRTSGFAPVACAAPVSRNGVSHQAAPNNSWGLQSPGRLPWLGDCGRSAPRPRYSCVPHAGADDLPLGVEDVQVPLPCMQVDAGVESVLAVVEAHLGHGLAEVGGGLSPGSVLGRAVTAARSLLPHLGQAFTHPSAAMNSIQALQM